MISDLQQVFSANAKDMKKSVIRELLKLTRRPEVISFAGGLPDPAAFPVDEVAEITADVLERDGALALQYSPTEGDPRLKEELIAHHEREDGIHLGPENMLITVASQQGLDLVSKVFVDRNDPVIVGLPSYVGGLGAFRNYGAHMIGVPLDDARIAHRDPVLVVLRAIKPAAESQCLPTPLIDEETGQIQVPLLARLAV